jgi:ribonuclease HII
MSEPKVNVIKRVKKKDVEINKGAVSSSKKHYKAPLLKSCFNENDNSIEIGVDEAGRGPMLGRVYTAAVILPKSDSFDHSLMKDSKKFHSSKKINEAAEYIKSNALYWHVAYADERTIENINIRNATHKAMHEAVRALIDKRSLVDKCSLVPFHLLVDGNDFKPFMVVNADMSLEQLPHTCIEGGDNLYSAIAAASILAKVERDAYIDALCESEPELNERYGLLSNKGYGTKIHMDGILKYGISQYHRKSFGICKNYSYTF